MNSVFQLVPFGIDLSKGFLLLGQCYLLKELFKLTRGLSADYSYPSA
jgi:hypothetical protein